MNAMRHEREVLGISRYGNAMNLGTGFELQNKRRFPRVFMAGAESSMQAIHGVLLSLPNRTHVPVLGLSVAGVIISPQGLLSQLRLGQVMECKLRVGIADPIPLKLRVIRMTAGAVCLMMESISSEHRLKIEQGVKDHVIFQNLHQQDSQFLHPALHNCAWWNGPFDTNFLAWRNTADSSLRKMIVEYDGTLLVWEANFDKSEVQIRKSIPATEEGRGYGGLWLEPEGPKVSLGHNWRDRLLRLMDSSVHSQELVPFRQLLMRV